MRIGFGYDVHPLIVGRPLILGGVTIPCEQGLDGHSDADVVVHALCDAMLGALALGDLGQHFPSTDERWRGVSSLYLLRHVNQLVAAQHYALGNADITVVAQRPRLAPYVPHMVHTLAMTVEVEASADQCQGDDDGRSGVYRCRDRYCGLCCLPLPTSRCSQ